MSQKNYQCLVRLDAREREYLTRLADHYGLNDQSAIRMAVKMHVDEIERAERANRPAP